MTRRSPARKCGLAVFLEDLGDRAAGARARSRRRRRRTAGRAAAASRLPMALLPAPIRPTRATVRGSDREKRRPCRACSRMSPIMRPFQASASSGASAAGRRGRPDLVGAALPLRRLAEVGCPRRAHVPFQKPIQRAHPEVLGRWSPLSSSALLIAGLVALAVIEPRPPVQALRDPVPNERFAR